MQTMEERIEKAIIDRFFEPSWMVVPITVSDPQTGGMRIEQTYSQTPSEMSNVSQAIYDAARAQIIAKVIERMDIDAIVAEWSPKIAKDVVRQLQVDPSYGWSSNPSKTARQKMMDKVYEDVAVEFGKQCVAHLKETGGLMNILEAPTT